ncbi:glycosyltransferase family 39 protein [Micromonospora sp. NBC_01699]|uniref:glycosyltransferase family 39 protein n=1 Tax=Micromonospora sp. NBC_01699 TaxID=2975984 RepID=UPI002E2D1F8E|nr:glycosyltransferase family 39 protein [Micromonospora sp. NBC_01699]
MTLTMDSKESTSVAPQSPKRRREPSRTTDGSDLRPAASLLAAVPAVVMLALAYWGAAGREMWNNEYATWHAVTLDLADLRRLLGFTDLVHTEYYLLLRGVTALFGDSPLALRAPSIVAMVVAAALVTLIGRRLWDTPTGVVAGLLFAVLPTVTRYAQEARSYALVTMGVALASWLLLRAWERPTRTRWALYGVVLALTGLLHFVAFMVLAAHLYLVFSSRPVSSTGEPTPDPRRFQWLGAIGSAALAVIPLLALAEKQSGSISWIKADVAAVRGFPGLLFGSWQLAALVCGLGVLAIAIARQRRSVVWMLLIWAALPPLVGYATFTWLHLFLPRYFVFTLPAWCLLAAITATESARALTRWRVRTMWVLGMAVLLPVAAFLSLPQQQEVRSSPVAGQPSYRSALDHIRDRAQPGDGVAFNDVFGKLSDLAREAKDYEWRRQDAPRDVFLQYSGAQRGSFSALECTDSAACLGDTKRIWLIVVNYADDPFDGLSAERADLFKLRFAIGEQQRFGQVRVVQLTRTY